MNNQNSSCHSQKKAHAKFNVSNWMSHENFKTVHVPSIKKLKSLSAAFLLSDLISYNNYFEQHDLLRSNEKYGEDWFPYSIEKCEQRLGLSVQEQKTAIQVLLKENLIEKAVFNVPAERHFRINFLECERLLFSKNDYSSVETHKLDCENQPNQFKSFNQTGKVETHKLYICNEMSKEMSKEKENITKENPPVPPKGEEQISSPVKEKGIAAEAKQLVAFIQNKKKQRNPKSLDLTPIQKKKDERAAQELLSSLSPVTSGDTPSLSELLEFTKKVVEASYLDDFWQGKVISAHYLKIKWNLLIELLNKKTKRNRPECACDDNYELPDEKELIASGRMIVV
jgi:hypothetical protein